jgi:PP-loop superfamily ATP-utilizing enzyme
LAVTPARLRQVEKAEQILRAAGIREFRVRHHGDVARIEIAADEMPHAIHAAGSFAPQIAALGFERVLLDVEGYRRGALNAALQLVSLRARDVAPDVRAAGATSDIAIVDALLTDIDRVRMRAQQLRNDGFRYVTIDLVRSA